MQNRNEREAAREIAQAEADLWENRLKDSFQTVLNTQAGRDVFNWLFSHCHMNSTTYRRNADSTYLEGMRFIGLEVEKRLKAADFEAYIQLLREQEKPTLEQSNDR